MRKLAYDIMKIQNYPAPRGKIFDLMNDLFKNADLVDWTWLLQNLKTVATSGEALDRGEAKFWLSVMTEAKKEWMKSR